MKTSLTHNGDIRKTGVRCYAFPLRMLAGITLLILVATSPLPAADVQDLLCKADGHFKQLEFKQAIETASKAIEADDTFAAAFNLRGKAYMGAGEPETAIEDFTKAINLEKNNEEALRGRALAYEFVGRLDESIDDYTAAIEVNSDSAYSYAGRAGIYVLQGKTKEANADFQKALECDVAKEDRQQLASELAGRAAIAVMKANNGVVPMVREGFDPGTITRGLQTQWDQALALGMHAADQAKIAFASNKEHEKHVVVKQGLVFCIKQFVQAADECKNELYPRAIGLGSAPRLPGVPDPELASLLWPELVRMRRDMLLDYAMTLGFARHAEESKEDTVTLAYLLEVLGRAGEDVALTKVANEILDLPESFEFPNRFHTKLKRLLVAVELAVAEQFYEKTELEMEMHNSASFPGEPFANEITHSSYMQWQGEQDEKFNTLLMNRNRAQSMLIQAERRYHLFALDDDALAKQIAALRKKMDI